MIINKDRFETVEQFNIALESIEKAYKKKYGTDGYSEMGKEQFQDFIDLLLYNSDADCFHGTDDEIRSVWYNLDMFE